MYFKREMVSGSLALHLNVTSELRHLTKPDIFHQLLGGGGSSWRPFSSWWIKMMRSSRKKNQRNAFLFGIHKSDNSQPLWKMGSGQKGWSQKSAYFSWPQDSGKALPNKPQPKKQHIAILLKKNLTVLKKQQHMAGWGVSERNIVITFEHSLYRLGEKGHFLGENMERSQSLSFESTIENGKGKEGFVPG